MKERRKGGEQVFPFAPLNVKGGLDTCPVGHNADEMSWLSLAAIKKVAGDRYDV